jgi:hypothetical protein
MRNLLAQLFQKLKFGKMLLNNQAYRRYLLSWLISQVPNYVFKKRIPWLVFDAIKYLDNLVIESKTIFEYGSGASTLYWLKRGAKCMSVEHDTKWGLKVQKYLNNFTNIDYRIVPPQKELKFQTDSYNDPFAYISKGKEYNNLSFKNYVQQIDEFTDGYFDIILIDGRARPSCIQHACHKVRPGGLLIVDDADRDYYFQKTSELLVNFEKISFIGPGPSIPLIWQTDIFVRKP